jgi:multiple sugar transport system permease protein
MKVQIRRKNNITAFLFLLPSFVGIICFSLFPIIISLIISLTKWNGLKKLSIFTGMPKFLKEEFIGPTNFINILTTEEFWKVLRNTSYFIILYIPLILIASIIVAAILNNTFKGITVYRIIYYIPVLTSWVAGSLIWKWVLTPDSSGIVNSLLGFIGIQGPGWIYDDKWLMPGVVFASVWKDMGFFGLILLGGLQGINPAYYEASKIDGAGWWKNFTKITLPLLSPVTFFIIIICIINSFQLFPQIMVMVTEVGGPQGAGMVMVERIYRYAFRFTQMGYASAMSWLLFAIIFIFTMLQMKLQDRWVHYES